MKLFIIEEIDGNTLYLSHEESDHLRKVLRIKQGDEVYATDGKGRLWKTKVGLIVPKRKVSLLVLSSQNNYKKAPYSIELAVCLPKLGDRMEWLLEKATEIGVDQITPILSEHSERRKINLIRSNKIIQSAAKQSLRAYIPTLNEPIGFDLFMEKKSKETQEKFIAHCNKEHQIKPFKESFIASTHLNFILLIGPEGDFSYEEIKKAIVYGYKPISLSKNRLRTETAAMIGLSYLHFLLDDNLLR